jgi:hypothetical protein
MMICAGNPAASMFGKAEILKLKAEIERRKAGTGLLFGMVRHAKK